MKKLTVLSILGLAISLLALPAQGDHCKGKHKNDLGCPGVEGVPYAIAYDFEGETSLTGAFNAAVVCTSQYCEFSAEGLDFVFNLPASFLDLFPADEATCFPSGLFSAHSVAFRSGHGETDWHGHVEVNAFTTAGEDVNYTFHFGGPCDDTLDPVCPLLPDGPGSLTFTGELLYVNLPSRGRGKRAAPGCTCAWEDCPEEDDVVLTLTEGSPP
jgi:hypothetical protein